MDKILELFINEPERNFHVREVAKLINKSPTTTSKYLSNLAKEGLLLSERKLNHLFFKANSGNRVFITVKAAFNIKKLSQSGLIDELIDQFNNPEAIVLFGSYGRGEDIPLSDIDILIITPIKKDLDLSPFEKILKRKIQIFLLSNQELVKMKTKNKELLNSMLNGLTLYGFWRLFK